MMIFLKLAWRNLWRNKRRTFITMASIVFAVLLAILLNSVKEGVLYKMQENIVSFYTGAIQIHKDGYWEDKTIDEIFQEDLNLRQQVQAHPSINQIIGRLESFTLAASDSSSKGCMVVGIEPEVESSVTNLRDRISKGDYLHEMDTAVLVSEGLAAYLKLDVNDTLVLIGQGYHGVSAAGKFVIKGLLNFASPELNKSMVYLPLKQAQWLFGAENMLSSLVLSVDDIDRSAMVSEELASIVSADYEVMNWQVLLPELNQVIEGERAENVIFLFVLYLLISFGIFGTIVMMTMERKFEFGVLVAIGMRKARLSLVTVFENVLISFIGAIVGILISVPIVGYFHKYPIHLGGNLAKAYESFGFEPVYYFLMTPKVFYSQAIVVLIVALILSVYPVFKIGRLEPVSAMRD